jgi:GNAT superfamily N-acetyltransferase
VTAGIAIRDGRPDEAAHLARLAQRAVPGDVVAAGGAALDSSTLEQEMAADRLFVAECDGRVAGYAAVREAGGALVLDQLVVAATDQGRGVGNALLDWVEGYGVSRRLEAVRVPSDGVDARARDFYLRRGYADGEAGLERALAHA